MPKISIIVPVFNTEKYLSKCINSIIDQTFTDFELLLINDGSSDKSGEICDMYAAMDTRIRVFHQANGGVSAARNKGLDYATGEWIAFVDSDDLISNTMYEEMYDMAVIDQSDIIYCDINMVFENYTSVYNATGNNESKIVFLNNYIASEWTSLCNILVKKSLFDQHQIYSPIGFPFAEDYHVSTRLFLYADKISYIPKPLYSYNRINESSALHNFSPDHYEKERLLNLDIIQFFIRIGEYKNYAKPLCWRLLKSLQELVLDKELYSRFLSIHPDSHQYIWSCPYLNIKIKIMMWSLSHNMRFIAESLLFVRDTKLKLFSLLKSN